MFTGQISKYKGTIQFDLDDEYKNIVVCFDIEECKNQSFNEDAEIQFKLINTEQGVCKAVALSKPGESKRKCGIITRIDKNKKVGYVQSCHDNKEYMFWFSECNNNINPMYLPKGTRIEFELRYFTKPQPEYKATKICLYLLPYQWLTYDNINTIWRQQTIDTSILFEKTYNSSAEINNLQWKIGDNMRVRKFQRKIKELKIKGGLVVINYNDEIKNLSIYFDFRELQFDAKFLRKGDEIIYELKKENYPKPKWKVINIQFANIIPFYWMTLFPNKRQQKNKWFNVPFRQNFDLERKYNSTHNVQFDKPINDTSSGKKYRRHTGFRGKLMSLPTENKPGKITVFYDKQFNNLLVDVDGKVGEFETNIEYIFEIIPNEKGLAGFKAVNLKAKLNYNKQIFIQSYSSKLIDVDIVNKIGKLELPSKLIKLLNTNNNNSNKQIWYWQTDDGEYKPFDKELAAKLEKLKVGHTLNYAVNNDDNYNNAFGSYVTKKISDDMAEQQNTFSGFKRKLVKKQAISGEYISFELFECKGFNASKLNKYCILEYNVMINKKHKQENDEDDEKMQTFPFKATHVRIPMVFYRWQKYDDVSRRWRAESRVNSIEYEEKYNNDHAETDDVIITDKKERIRRIIRFRGKILNIDRMSKRGQVRINYSKEYGKEIGLWFNFRDCKFNANYLQIGDDVEYNLRGNTAINVKLWLIPFKYIYKLQNDIDNAENWKEFTYHQCRELETKYNPEGDDCKDFDYLFNNTLVVTRRITTFKSKAIFDRHNRNTCYLTVIYCENRNLGIRVPYSFKINDNILNIRHGNYVSFELKRNLQTRSWKIDNIKKIKYENKQVLQLRQQLEELKENMNNNDRKIEYKWKWKDDDDSFNIYKPDISNKLNKLKIGQTFLFSTSLSSFKYTIRKLSDDSATQTNNSTQRAREIKRFTIRKTTVNDDNDPEFAIPDGEFYQYDYNKLNDDEIKQLFYATVNKANFKIIDIEEVEIAKQTRLYELNLWCKCDELKKSRDEVEKYLWHGSSYDVINVIIQNGFDRSYSSVALYGCGTYFARHAKYSVSGYCSKHCDGYQYILLCKVIVGDSTKGSSSIKKVPLKSNQVEYDTLVDNTDNPSIYVVWRDYTAIPVYRIKFKSI